MKNRLLLITIIVAVILSGCKEIEPGGTATQNLCGEWWVKFESQNNEGVWMAVSDYTFLSTYNSAANTSNELWIDDHESWGYEKIRITTADPYNFKFAQVAETVDNVLSFWNSHLDPYWVKVVVSGGEVFKNKTKAPSGVVTDSICFYMNYSDDTLYRISGYKKTGYHEDDH